MKEIVSFQQIRHLNIRNQKKEEIFWKYSGSEACYVQDQNKGSFNWIRGSESLVEGERGKA